MQTIDVKLAREYVLANYPLDPLLRQIALTLLEQLPKVPAVEVVRCKDCAKREVSLFDGSEFCVPCGYRSMDPEWYCPEGERRKT